MKELLLSQSESVRLDVGSWFISIFIWIVFILIIQSLSQLAQRTWKKNILPISKPILVVFLAIIFLLVGFWLYTQIFNPLPSYANYDPEISYLVNSLTPFKDLELYRRMDHPGTFMQLIGSTIAVILSPLSMAKGGFPYQYHLEHPEAFLFTARLILLMVNIGVLYILFKSVRGIKKWSGTLVSLSILLVYFASHKSSLEFLTIWSPNSFNFAAGTAILLILYRVISNQEGVDNRTLWLFSIATGLAATFHIYMITLIIPAVSGLFLSALFTTKDWNHSLKIGGKVLLGSIVGYITGTLVILPYYGSFITWIFDIITHQGIYGFGETGFTSLGLLFNNIKILFQNNWALFSLWGLLSVILISVWLKSRDDSEKHYQIWAFIIGVYLQIAFLILMIGKHPVDRYLLSLASTLPLLILALYDLTKNQLFLPKIIFGILSVLLSILFIYNLGNTISNHINKVEYLSLYQAEVNNFITSYAEEKMIEPDQVSTYWTYGTYSPCYSLWLGNDFSKKRFTKEILELCPNQLQFNVWNESITGSKLRGFEAIKEQHQHIILIGNDRTLANNAGDAYQYKSDVEDLGFIYFR